MGIVTILDAIAARLIADEIKAWLPGLSNKLLNRAVDLLPTKMQSTYREQWAADIADIAGDISKALYCVDLIRASVGIALDDEQTTLAREVKLWMLWKTGFLKLELAEWKQETEMSDGSLHGTIRMVLVRVTLKDWFGRVTQHKFFPDFVGNATPRQRKRLCREGGATFGAVIVPNKTDVEELKLPSDWPE
jgi:hypothetical protein